MIDASKVGPFAPGELEQALERFSWLADELGDEACRVDPRCEQEVLDDKSARTSQKERALVRLALLASARSEAVLRWFVPGARSHRRIRLLHRLALSECARRVRRAGEGDQAPDESRAGAQAA